MVKCACGIEVFQTAMYRALREASDWDSMYRQPLYGIGTRLNEALSAVVADLRAQMLADRDTLLHSRPAGP